VFGLVVGVIAGLAVQPAPGVAATGVEGVRPVGGATLSVVRGQRPVLVPLYVRRGGEAVLDLVADAPGVSWAAPGRESAVVSVHVDGRYTTDLVVPSDRRTPRSLALAHLGRGLHVVSLRFAADRSPAGARRVNVRDVRVSVAAPGSAEHLARRYAPVLLGRTLPELGSVFQNATTDTPLLAWHEVQVSPVPGLRRINYSIVWSNEDGGTDSPALMARWGRTTDIEWVYAIDVDAAGNQVGPAFYQGPNHQTLPFTGKYEGTHPVLQTCTVNNTVCDQGTGPMRFFLAADQTRPERRAREYLMDTNPWAYPVMAEELEREGKIETPSDPATPAVGDQRTYLYLEVDKDTTPVAGPAPGVSVLVKLRGNPTGYRSDHGVPSWSIARDDPAATTVDLPAGTTAADIVEITAVRVPASLDNQAPVTVTDINRAFFLDQNRLPRASFIAAHALGVQLTAAAPTATIWTSTA
jgi:hypothetical protein